MIIPDLPSASGSGARALLTLLQSTLGKWLEVGLWSAITFSALPGQFELNSAAYRRSRLHSCRISVVLVGVGLGRPACNRPVDPARG